MPGYDVADSQFKNNTSEGISKYRCPECSLILRDAVQPSCGHWLCSSCADVIFQKKKPHCPRDDCQEELVPEDGQNFFPDRFVRREILNFAVTCSNKPLGCDWEGTLSKLESHLSECTFAQVTCECGKTMPRTELPGHKKTKCPKSKKQCPLSKIGCSLKAEMTREDLHSHFNDTEDIIEHFDLLASYVHSMYMERSTTVHVPLKRPPADGADLTADSGYKSMDAAQPNRVFDVEKDGGGETTKGPRRFKPQLGALGPEAVIAHVDVPYGGDMHLSSAFSGTHLPAYFSKVLQDSVEKVRADLRKDYMGEIELRDNRIKVLETQVAQMQKTIQTKNSEIEDRDFRLSLIENSNYDGTMIWKIPQFSQRMTDAKTGKYTSIFSLPFYSSRYGYKMCLRLYIMGDGIGKQSHMSLFFVIMRGEFDNILPWPFTQRVTFRLINQGNGRDIVDTFQPDPMSSSFKKPKSDMNIASGCPRFISHDNLKSGGYIVEDTIFIKCVVDRSTLSHP